MREIKEIIVHCSATPRGKHFTVEDIDRWHRKRGFRCIGYHYVVYLDGSIHEGRPLEEIGANCKGHNEQSIGVCYIGGMDATMNYAQDTRTLAQKQSLRTLLVRLKCKYPHAQIYGHRDFAAKACPSFDAKTEYANI